MNAPNLKNVAFIMQQLTFHLEEGLSSLLNEEQTRNLMTHSSPKLTVAIKSGKGEMAEKVNLHGRDQKYIQDFSWKSRRKESTWGISINIGIILKGILNNQATRL